MTSEFHDNIEELKRTQYTGLLQCFLDGRSRLEANRVPPLGTLEKAVEGTVKKERYAYLKELHYRELNAVVGVMVSEAGEESRDPRSPARQGTGRGDCTWPVHWRGPHRFFSEDREGRRKITEVLITEDGWRKTQPGDMKEVVHGVPRRSNFTASNPHQSPGPGGYTKPPAAPARGGDERKDWI